MMRISRGDAMSMMRCAECSELTDTDYDLNGLWLDLGYICESCTEGLAEDACDTANECGECKSCKAREAMA